MSFKNSMLRYSAFDIILYSFNGCKQKTVKNRLYSYLNFLADKLHSML